MVTRHSPDEIVELLGLVPLPDEGGMWGQVWIDENSTAIHYLLADDDFSAMHRLPGPEVYHHYMGAPTQMLLLHPDGSIEQPVLGTDLEAGQRPTLVVPSGVWQGCRPVDGWSLLGTTMSPPFAVEDFELGERIALTDSYPEARPQILALTR